MLHWLWVAISPILAQVDVPPMLQSPLALAASIIGTVVSVVFVGIMKMLHRVQSAWISAQKEFSERMDRSAKEFQQEFIRLTEKSIGAVTENTAVVRELKGSIEDWLKGKRE